VVKKQRIVTGEVYPKLVFRVHFGSYVEKTSLGGTNF
jgi:hypothetical protein